MPIRHTQSRASIGDSAIENRKYQHARTHQEDAMWVYQWYETEINRGGPARYVPPQGCELRTGMPPRKWPPLKVAKAPCPCNVVNESAAVNEWRDKRVRAAEQGDVAHCRAARTCCALCRVHVAPSRKRRPLSGPRPSRTHQSVRRNSGKPCKRALKKLQGQRHRTKRPQGRTATSSARAEDHPTDGLRFKCYVTRTHATH